MLLVLSSALAMSSTLAAVVTCPAPAGEETSQDDQVLAGGKPVAVCTARTPDTSFAGKEWDSGGPCAFANFDIDGPVEVRITSARSLRNTVIRPARPDVKTRMESNNTFDTSWLHPSRKRDRLIAGVAAVPTPSATLNPQRKETHAQARQPIPEPFTDPKSVQAERKIQTQTAHVWRSGSAPAVLVPSGFNMKLSFRSSRAEHPVDNRENVERYHAEGPLLHWMV